MSELEKTDIQNSCSMNGSPQKIIKEKKTDAQNVSKNMNDIKIMTNGNITNNEETKYCKSNSDVSDKTDLKDKEIIDIITQLALPYAEDVKEMINSHEITFEEMERHCSSHVKELMKTLEDDNKSNKERKSDWKLFKKQEKKCIETYKIISKEVSQMKDAFDSLLKDVPLVELPKKKSVATQCNSTSTDPSPEDRILQPSSKLRNSTYTDCKVQGVNTVLSPSSSIIILSSDDEL